MFFLNNSIPRVALQFCFEQLLVSVRSFCSHFLLPVIQFTWYIGILDGHSMFLPKLQLELNFYLIKLNYYLLLK